MPLLVGDVERISSLQPANILSKKCKTSGLLLYHQQLPIDLKRLALVDSIVPLEVSTENTVGGRANSCNDT